VLFRSCLLLRRCCVTKHHFASSGPSTNRWRTRVLSYHHLWAGSRTNGSGAHPKFIDVADAQLNRERQMAPPVRSAGQASTFLGCTPAVQGSRLLAWGAQPLVMAQHGTYLIGARPCRARPSRPRGRRLRLGTSPRTAPPSGQPSHSSNIARYQHFSRRDNGYCSLNVSIQMYPRCFAKHCEHGGGAMR
jgi:hypothetical protein